MKTDELREKYLAFFASKGCVRRPSDVLVPRWSPSVLFTPAGMNQFKDHFLGRCKLEFTRANDLPEMSADRRHRQRRPHGLPPHLFRDAGQLQLRRLFQAGSDQLGVGIPHREAMAGPQSRPPLGDNLPGRRGGGGHLAQRRETAAGAAATHGRGRELLARQRPQPGPRRRLRSVQRNLLPRRFRASRDLEPRLHAVQPRRRPAGQSPAAAQQEHRHGDGPGADRRGAPGRGDEFSHRHPSAAGRGRRRSLRRRLSARRGNRPPPAPHRRSPPRVRLRRARERASGQQEAGLRRPPPLAPRRAGRPPDGRPPAVPPPTCRRRRRIDEAAVSRTGRDRPARRRGHREGGGELPFDDRRRPRPHRADLRADEEGAAEDRFRRQGRRHVPNSRLPSGTL